MSWKFEHIFDGLIKHILMDIEADFKAREIKRDLPDWRYIKAIMRAESDFDPLAVSHCQARGLTQFMPPTWYNERGAKWKNERDAFDIYENIEKCCEYMTALMRTVQANGVGKDESLKYASASYNCGWGNVIKARRKANEAGKNKHVFVNIREYLPKETRDYVDRIQKFYKGYLNG